MSHYFKNDKINLYDLDNPTFINSSTFKPFQNSFTHTTPTNYDFISNLYLFLIYSLLLYILFQCLYS